MGKIRKILGVDEFSSSYNIKALLRALLAEFIGNLLLNFFGCRSIVAKTNSVLTISLTIGLVIFVCIQAIGHVSGGHYNPAVSIGMLSVGNISVIRALLYVIVQCIGATVGSAILMALLPKTHPVFALGHTSLSPNVTPLQGLGFEFFLGFILVLVISGVCDPDRPDAKAAGPLAIGLTVSLGHLALIGFTGASMNPARSFGSAVIAGIWKNIWVYWAGPIIGGVLAALTYHFGYKMLNSGSSGDEKI